MTNNLFDANFYRTANPDLASLTDAQLSEHFTNFGLNEGRSFSPFVDLKFYGDKNPDLAAAGLTTNKQLYEHLQNFGVADGRQFSPVVDLGLYLTKNPDLNAAFSGNRERAFEHLQTFGIPEGRQFSLVFDLNAYRQANPDLVTAGLNNQQLLQHFARFGMDEGRLASPFFNARYYLQRHPDLVSAGLNFRQAFQHFVSSGLSENRSPFPGFSEAGYLEFNPDVRQAVEQGQLRSGFEHYVNFGADDTGATNAGAAYLYDGTTGALLRTFTNPTPEAYDYFGSRMAAVGNNILIAAPNDDSGATNAGSAYLFDGTTGALLRTFTNPTPVSGDRFGSRVAAVGNNILIGAPNDDSGATNTGSAYLFDGTTGALLQNFPNPSSEIGDLFGNSVAALGNHSLINAPNERAGNLVAGAVYLF